MPRYAETTRVPAEKTRSELDALLAKHGATARAIAADDVAGNVLVGFTLGNRQVRIPMHIPSPKEILAGGEPRGWWSWDEGQRRAWLTRRHEQVRRQRWRSLLLRVKAKLEGIADGETSVDQEFLHHVMLPGGQTVGQLVAAQVDEAYMTGVLPPLLPGAGSTT